MFEKVEYVTYPVLVLHDFGFYESALDSVVLYPGKRLLGETNMHVFFLGE